MAVTQIDEYPSLGSGKWVVQYQVEAASREDAIDQIEGDFMVYNQFELEDGVWIVGTIRTF